MRLILVRHGETEHNKKQLLIGRVDISLTEKGREQARKLALRLKDEEIDVIYCSDLKRAAETGREIARFHPRTPFVFTEELRERDFGKLEGRSMVEIGWDDKNIDVEERFKLHDETGNGETFEDLFRRAEAFLQKTLEKHPKETVLFSTHGTIIRAFVCAITGKSSRDIFSMERHGNTAVSIFEIGEDRSHRIHLLGDTSHVE